MFGNAGLITIPYDPLPMCLYAGAAGAAPGAAAPAPPAAAMFHLKIPNNYYFDVDDFR